MGGGDWSRVLAKLMESPQQNHPLGRNSPALRSPPHVVLGWTWPREHGICVNMTANQKVEQFEIISQSPSGWQRSLERRSSSEVYVTGFWPLSPTTIALDKVFLACLTLFGTTFALIVPSCLSLHPSFLQLNIY